MMNNDCELYGSPKSFHQGNFYLSWSPREKNNNNKKKHNLLNDKYLIKYLIKSHLNQS